MYVNEIKNNQNPTPKIAFNKVYEPCCYGTIGKPYLNTGMNNANEILNQEVTTGNQVHDEILDMIDIWIEKRDSTKDYQHPTQKPVTLAEKPFKRCSAPLHVIFSGFAGSGSDLIAAEELGRAWRGVEKDLIFATIIIDRWEKFANLKATKIYESN
jgi:DNA modification methylase